MPGDELEGGTERGPLDVPQIAKAVATAYDKDGDSLEDIDPPESAVSVYGDELSAKIVAELATISDWGHMTIHELDKEHPLDNGEPTEFRRGVVAVVEVLLHNDVPLQTVLSDLDTVAERFSDAPAEDVLAWCRRKEGDLP